jgi:7-cyano-7-deazaguanine synthase in queuosine biosynthesis
VENITKAKKGSSISNYDVTFVSERNFLILSFALSYPKVVTTEKKPSLL